MTDDLYISFLRPVDHDSDEFKALPPDLQEALWDLWLSFLAHKGRLPVAAVLESGTSG